MRYYKLGGDFILSSGNSTYRSFIVHFVSYYDNRIFLKIQSGQNKKMLYRVNISGRIYKQEDTIH